MLKQVMRSAAETKKLEKRAVAMTTEELSGLSCDRLLFAAIARAENKIGGFEELADGIASLNETQRVIYSLNWLESEVNNGGLCQFFVNSSRIVAPFVSEYMKLVGAEEHKRLFDDFVRKNGIDLNDLSFFDIEGVDGFAEKNEAFPFDEYDDAFYKLEPLDTFLKRFAAEHKAEL